MTNVEFDASLEVQIARVLSAEQLQLVRGVLGGFLLPPFVHPLLRKQRTASMHQMQISKK